jgi:hypothetical protein
MSPHRATCRCRLEAPHPCATCRQAHRRLCHRERMLATRIEGKCRKVEK